MELRKQKKIGNKRDSQWTIKEIEAGLRQFYKDNNRYPTATEIDTYEYLPSSRTLERSFGGIVEIRKNLNLGEEHDFRRGSHSSKRAHIINKRSNKLEQQVYEFLIKNFNKEFVHREYLFTDDARTRADFFVYDNENGFCVDVFYPGSIRNLSVCLNIKINKYKHSGSLLNLPVIFLQMNEDIQQDNIDKLIIRKKNPMPKEQIIMCWNEFQEFCKNKKSLKVFKDQT